MIPCTHGMPTPLACVECMNEGNIPPPKPKPRHATWSGPIEARFPGRCVYYDDTINEGDLIRVFAAKAAHDTCATDNGADQ